GKGKGERGKGKWERGKGKGDKVTRRRATRSRKTGTESQEGERGGLSVQYSKFEREGTNIARRGVGHDLLT
ncbi:MAG: hypothetical protein ACK53Y_19070, partial [bacterium]